ncbi:MAG TPA: hypothetical protein ACFYD4_14570 [Candidatus Wunengus sp. YC61]|uniref:hypothetical protein n=1 Tax=Candidatus Wunengus sp. YC61 TaxID=3367698 RepID=UPI004024AB0C
MSKTIKTVGGFGVTLDEYKGSYSLRQDREYNGKWYWVMCKLVFGKEEKLAEKASPIKIPLGDKKKAREVLEAMLGQLCDDKRDDSDNPF